MNPRNMIVSHQRAPPARQVGKSPAIVPQSARVGRRGSRAIGWAIDNAPFERTMARHTRVQEEAKVEPDYLKVVN